MCLVWKVTCVKRVRNSMTLTEKIQIKYDNNKLSTTTILTEFTRATSVNLIDDISQHIMPLLSSVQPQCKRVCTIELSNEVTTNSYQKYGKTVNCSITNHNFSNIQSMQN